MELSDEEYMMVMKHLALSKAAHVLLHEAMTQELFDTMMEAKLSTEGSLMALALAGSCDVLDGMADLIERMGVQPYEGEEEPSVTTHGYETTLLEKAVELSEESPVQEETLDYFRHLRKTAHNDRSDEPLD